MKGSIKRIMFLHTIVIPFLIGVFICAYLMRYDHNDLNSSYQNESDFLPYLDAYLEIGLLGVFVFFIPGVILGFLRLRIAEKDFSLIVQFFCMVLVSLLVLFYWCWLLLPSEFIALYCIKISFIAFAVTVSMTLLTINVR